MKTNSSYILKPAVALFIAALVVALFLSSRVSGDDKTSGTASNGTATATESNVEQEKTKGGSQLWSENCARCHNMRPPTTYSDGEWQVVMHHMRIRAQLTAEEYKAILEFLESAN
jgi:cytochrome c5